MKIKLTQLAAAALLACVATQAIAQDTNPAVDARRGFFKAMYFNAGPLFGMLKDKVPYNAEQAKTLANNVKLMTMMSTDAMWQSGTDNATLKGQTRMLPAAVTDAAGFAAKWDDWRKAAAELADAAGTGKEAMVEKMKAMGATCGACHKAYRAKDF
jgi:cytochrome c556